MECKRAQNLIDAYLDGELDPLHAMEVEAHLQECLQCARQLESRKTLQTALRTKLPYYTAPLSLRQSVAVQPARKWKFATAALAACLAVAVGGLSLALATRGAGPGREAVLAEAVESEHLRSLLMPEHLTDVVSSSKHTVKPWFAGKLPFAPPVPDLSAEKFELVGGRLDVLQGRTVAAVVYRRGGHVINLFMWPAGNAKAESGVPMPTTTATGHHLVHWACAGFECWAVSDLEAGELQKFGEAFEKVVEG